MFVRWLQDPPVQTLHGFPPPVGGDLFYRTCVIDAVLEASPAVYVRRPPVPAESPTLGLSHLQFEAMIVAARTSTNPFDFALVAMLGLLGLRIFEACGSTIDDLGEEHGHRVLRVRGKGTKIVLVPLPPAVGRAIDRAIGDRTAGPILLNRIGPAWTATPPPADSSTWPRPPGSGYPGCIHICCGTFVTTTPASASAMSRSPPGMRIRNHDAI